ncbi:MAG: DUF3971 domain-containing protein [Rhodobacteraceae bacterium]|nr:DUF3971 domain-containing protein [Paracoccaceae bacterium]
MTEIDRPVDKKIRRRRRRRRAARATLLSAVLLALALSGLMLLLAMETRAPDWARERFEKRLNQSISNASVKIGNIRISAFSGGFTALAMLDDVQLLDPDGRIRATLPEVEIEIAGSGLLSGRLQPLSLRLHRAHLNLTREPDGSFDIRVGVEGGGAEIQQNRSYAEIIAAVENIFAQDFLARLHVVESTSMSVFLRDDVSGRSWTFQDGGLVIENNPAQLAANVTFALESQEDDDPSTASFGWKKPKGQQVSVFSSQFTGLRTNDLADQIAAFDWLRLLDAPIAGSVTMEVTGDGRFGQMNGVLDIGAGVIAATQASDPVRFSGAKAYLSYDDRLEKFTFNQIALRTDAAHIIAEGHAYIGDRIDRTIGAVIAQLKFTKVLISPEGMFGQPLEFSVGALDMRVQTAPLIVDIGQMVLVDAETSYVLKGRLAAGAEGWTNALDLAVKSVSTGNLLNFWPLTLKQNTRRWLATNILDGRLENIRGAFRTAPGEPPRLSVNFDVAGAAVRFMKTMPPIENGIGYGVLTDQSLTIAIEQGQITAPGGGVIDAAGSHFTIPDIRVRFAPADIDLKAKGPLHSFLTLLDQEPFRFLSKAGLGPDIASGHGEVAGRISLPLAPKVELNEVNFTLKGVVRNARSDMLVKGRLLTAEEMAVFVDPTGLTVSGAARIGSVPANGLWRQDFGLEAKGKSRIDGNIEISQALLDEFNIILPEGSVDGKGSGHIDIAFERGKRPSFTLLSDLNRLALSLEQVGFSKPKNETGRLAISGSFGSPAAIDAISLTTRGLKAEGKITLKSDGTLDVARFSQVDIGGWMVTPVDIRIGPDGQANFDIGGGEVDFRASRFSSGPGNGEAGNRIAVKLDRLIVSSGIALTGVEGELTTRGGVSGGFSGRINGGARIVGALAPDKGGTAVRLSSKQAGEVMRSAGLFASANGGHLDMVLVPGGVRGEYEGSLTIKDTRVKNANALADLLAAISVVGLLEQLGGEGISFTDIDARFRLLPEGVKLHRSSAVGPALGLTMDGVYGFTTGQMDMQGVITPIYILNGVLEQTKLFGKLFGKQKGEGLFGFTYTLKGDADEPKVGVNPLSILTPGMFREMFRQPVPERPE